MSKSLKNLQKLDPAYFHTGMQSKRLLRQTSMARARLQSTRGGATDAITRAHSLAWHRAKGVYYGNRAADAVCLLTGEGAMPWPLGRFFDKHRSKAVKAGPLAWGVAGLTVAVVTSTVALVSAAIMGACAQAQGRGFGRGASDGVGMGVYVGVHAAAITSKLVALFTGSLGLGVRIAFRAVGYAAGSVVGHLPPGKHQGMDADREPLLGAV